ncbi:MAG TPA: zf-TFIIB domain-containing protein [Melioribacteraceae bacterium]|nr:zf-TFIIB domain-containing protein [Melioribacteraceae bacterium]
MKCPNCNVNLVMSEKKGIEVDYCPECRGIWLDKGELDKIVERSIDFEPQQNIDNDFNRNDYGYQKKYDDDYYKRRRKKSFLGELFDFD